MATVAVFGLVDSYYESMICLVTFPRSDAYVALGS